MTEVWTIRRATLEDDPQIAALFDAVAGEGRWIGRELPIDHEERRARFVEGLQHPETNATFVAVTPDGELIGDLGIGLTSYGVADLGMMVADGWRGAGVGSALLATAIAWARTAGAHKIALQHWPHNERAHALYRTFGFVEEGRLVRHYRRNNGELWDAVIMGLELD
jgi:RimJ/RimL family protein N-acetyltransferase